MSEFQNIIASVVVNPLIRFYAIGQGLLPELSFSIIVLLVGWLCAVILKKIAAKILKALGLDMVSEKVGFQNFLERGGVKRTPSAIIGLAFYWLIILSALVMVFNTLGLTAAAQFIEQIIYFIPKIFVALIFLALGLFLGKFVGKLVEKTSNLANLPFSDVLAKISSYAVIGLSIMLIFKYLNVPDIVSIEIFIVIFSIIPLALFLLFLIGGRDIILSVLAGRVLAKELKTGNKIEFDSVSGEIESIDLIMTKIKKDKETIIIANSELAKKAIKMK